MIMIPCIDFAAARKSAQVSGKGGVRTVLGYHNFEQPPYKPQTNPELTSNEVDTVPKQNTQHITFSKIPKPNPK